ncbi:MAG: signal recognition particle-docking protein FtsY [Flavobacteriales bacterium]|nr:signal recognition particle-docking protein FtsY [Flavobacteriales bacterium]
MGLFDFFKKEKSVEEKQKLDQGLEKTKSSIFSKISKALVGKSSIDDDFLDELEEILISSDVGVNTTLNIIDRLQKRVSKDKYIGAAELNSLLKDEISHLLTENKKEDLNASAKPYVVMVVGVNGVGKTTTIGKLANMYKNAGKKVLLGAGDTFRAAAVDQLTIWSQRVGVPIVSKGMNTDPAAVAFDAVKQGVDQDVDLILIDTAGRLHNKVNLMNELSKIKRVMSKVIPDAPHEVLLVLDASTGQNAYEQAKQFTAATEVNALALTKLDGTARGGVVIGISEQFKIPVKYIGIGEGINDIQYFEPTDFVESLFSN